MLQIKHVIPIGLGHGTGFGTSPAAIARGIASTVQQSSGNVWCVGRNYAEHVKELGNVVEAGDPMIFLKAGSSLLASGSQLKLPSWSRNVHHEVELALQLGPDLQPTRGAVALDLTLRDIQDTLKKKGHPWTLAKSFPQSAPIGGTFALEGLDLQDLELRLTVNGKTRQHGNTKDMIYKVPQLLQYIQSRFPVVPGDWVLTGTPHGVSALQAGDKVVAQVSSSSKLLSEGTWHAVRD